MKKLIEYSVRHPISVLMYFLLFFVTGFLSLFTIKMDYLPFISDRTILINSSYPGIPAEQMKELVTIPMEDSFCSLKGIKNISSITRDGLSILKIELQYGTNINSALIESRQIIDRLSAILPQNCSKPEAEIFSTQKNQLIKLAVIPKNNDLINARNEADNEIKHEFQKINGVGKISITGGLKEQIDVILDPSLTISKGISLQQVQNAIINSNYEYPAGTISDYKNEYILKTSGLYKTLDDILQTPVITGKQNTLIKDIGKTFSGTMDKESFSYFNNNECILISISKKTDFSPISVSKKIHAKIDDLKTSYPNLNFVIIEDVSRQISNSIMLVYISALISSVITFRILLLFFKNLKISFIISLVIPLCILFSITVLKITGKTINLFSLSGISISLGMIVDSSIVSIESILSRVRSKITDSTIISSIQQVSKSNLSSSLTTIIVFIPFFLLPGIFGELFCDLAISITASIFYSLLISFSFIPACVKLFKIESKIQKQVFFSKIEQFYSAFLKRKIKNKMLPVKIIIFSFLSAAILFPFLKKSIIQTTKENKIEFALTFPPDYSLEHIQSKTETFLKTLTKNFDTTLIICTGGIEQNDFETLSDVTNSDNKVIFTVFFNNNELKALRLFLESQNQNFTYFKSQDLVSKTMDLNETFIISSEIPSYIQSQKVIDSIFDGVSDLFPNYYQTEHIFTPDSLKCNYYRIPKYYISTSIYQLFEGLEAGTFLKKGKYIPVRIMFDKAQLNEKRMFVQTGNKTIPVSALGSFTTEYIPKILFRYNKIDSKKTDSIEKMILQNKKCIDTPYIITSTSQKQKTELLYSSILLCTVTLILLYCLLGAQFESFLMPLIFLITIIPAFFGAFLFLFVFAQSLNIHSILALIILFGTSVNNSIILYEGLNLKTQNIENKINYFVSKLRPIALTTLTSICALIPFTINLFGINTQTSMAIALTGGLSVSLPVVLIIYPVIFSTHHKRSLK